MDTIVDDSDQNDSGVGSDVDKSDVAPVKTTEQTAAEVERQTLARAETRYVKSLRVVMVGVLLAMTLAISLLTCLYSRYVEQEEFEAHYAAISLTLVDNFHDSFERRLSALDGLGTGITSYAKNTQQIFPNVTVMDFEVMGAIARIQADSAYIIYMPVVTDETRAGFEAYAEETFPHYVQSFYAEHGMRAQQDTKYGYVEVDIEGDSSNGSGDNGDENDGDGSTRKLHARYDVPHDTVHRIYGDQGDGDPEPEGTGPYLPAWATTPALPSIAGLMLNFKTFSYLAGPFDEVLRTGTAVVGGAVVEFENVANNDQNPGSSTETIVNAFLSMSQFRHDLRQFQRDPWTFFCYPVFDSFGSNRQVAGLLYTQIYWRMILEKSLPDDTRGIIVVLRNTLGQIFSYRLDGPVVTYLGAGDYHDTEYNEFEVSRDVSEFIAQRAGVSTQSFTAADLNSEYSTYTLSIYPSSDTESMFVSSRPIIYTLVIGFTFLATCLIFLLYDFMVERRQKKVLDKAVKSTAVVSSLFPQNVHDRLFAASVKNSRTRIQAFMVDQTSGEMTRNGRPIADHFEDCSVLFADLAGFTKWSSSRSPEDVFLLLEKLFGSLDKIALRRNVFKVETIGDCYMAATGIPESQGKAEHAVIMVRFALQCMSKFQVLINELADTLGTDTRDLGFRVGIHSGPVTAGVLRGERSRFQLFGDTVNTASRMESNGERNRIHISQETADLLMQAGFASRLVERQGKIQAKGKGLMQTYFVDTAAFTHVATSVISSTKEEQAPYYQSQMEQHSPENDNNTTPTNTGTMTATYPQGLRDVQESGEFQI